MELKIDRVASVAQATDFVKLGATWIGVDLHEREPFAEQRIWTPEDVRTLIEELPDVHVVAHVDPQTHSDAEVLQDLTASGARYAQVFRLNGLPSSSVRAELEKTGVRMVYGGIDASYEDDPSWVLSGHLAKETLALGAFQVELLTENENAWAFMRDEAPKASDDLQLKDLEQLASEHPIFLSADFTPATIVELQAYLPSVRGVALTLGRLKQGRYDLHVHSDDSIPSIAEALAL